jgi:ABC-2 type transport system permease protein
MSILTEQTTVRTPQRRSVAHTPMPMLAQVVMMTQRSVITLVRTPQAVLPNIFISVFLLLVFHAALGGTAEFLPAFRSVDYIAFLLPFTIISAVLDSPGGQSMVRDIENGYFDKLLLTPISRPALILGHIIASGLVVVLASTIIIAVGFALGLRPATGIGGVFVTLLFALLIGSGFAGFTIGVALRTGSAAATQGASFAFFPLSFMSTAFFPLEYLQGWLRVVAELNPITYILDALRGVMIVGWEPEKLALGLAASALVSILPFMFALASLHTRTRRR